MYARAKSDCDLCVCVRGGGVANCQYPIKRRVSSSRNTYNKPTDNSKREGRGEFIVENLTDSAPPPLVHSYRLGLVSWRCQVRIPVRPDICHRGCAYSVLQTVQRSGVYGAAYGTVHYEEPLKLFEIRVGHSPSFGLPFARYFHNCAESDVKQYSYILTASSVMDASRL